MINRLNYALTLSQFISLLSLRVSIGSNGELDQSHVIPPNPNHAHAYGVASSLEAAQTFTVGRYGLLSDVEVALYRPLVSFDGTITVDISRVVAGTPDFSPTGVLATRTVANDTVPVRSVHEQYISEFSMHVDYLSSHVFVSPGDKLAIILRPNDTGANYYNWWANIATGPSYAGGSVFHHDLINDRVTNEGRTQYDAQFRTFVFIPEPTAILLAVLGVFGHATLLRRR